LASEEVSASFSEEKEAKRLYDFGSGAAAPPTPEVTFTELLNQGTGL
jgi:hypothetical protein